MPQTNKQKKNAENRRHSLLHMCIYTLTHVYILTHPYHTHTHAHTDQCVISLPISRVKTRHSKSEDSSGIQAQQTVHCCPGTQLDDIMLASTSQCKAGHRKEGVEDSCMPVIPGASCKCSHPCPHGSCRTDCPRFQTWFKSTHQWETAFTSFYR